jgi:myo-inositol-1(or 4)-monophosphatase
MSSLEPRAKTIVEAIGAAKSVFDSTPERVVRRKLDGSLVTNVDVEIQRAIVACIRDRHPDDEILAEEGDLGTDAVPRGANWWAIDPIDGTTNFANGVPVFCTSVAVCKGRKPIAGAVWVPVEDRIYASWDQAKPSWTESPSLSQLRIGFEYEGTTESRAQLANIASALIPSAGVIRMFGSAAVALAWVAAGRLDAFLHPSLHPWDYAAGAALILSAGGKISSPLLGGKSDWVLAGSSVAFPVLTDFVDKHWIRSVQS